MKNKTLAVIAAGLFSGMLICQQAQAIPLSGNITFSGGVVLDTASADTATAVTAWVSPVVSSRDGDFAGFVTVNDAVTMAAPWTFASGALPGLWSVDGFTFDLISSAIFAQPAGGGFVVVHGTGTVSGHGFGPTVGDWSFTTQNPGAGSPLVFSFSASTGVPDGGLTIVFLGSAIVGLGLLRRKLS